MWRTLAIGGSLVAGAVLLVHSVLAQTAPAPSAPMHRGSMPHDPAHQMHHMHHAGQSGQDAFGAIAEVVRILDADPSVDWSKVDLERLRQHLIDMNEVVLHAQVKQTPVPGGLVMDITGSGRTDQAIRAMVVPHALEVDRMASLTAKAETIPGGVRLTVTVKGSDDAKAVARVRGLGFIGLLTLGAHHGPHHLAMAKGEPLAGHGH